MDFLPFLLTLVVKSCILVWKRFHYNTNMPRSVASLITVYKSSLKVFPVINVNP